MPSIDFVARRCGWRARTCEIVGRHDLHPVAHAHPLARQVVGAELHAQRGRAGIVVEQQDVHARLQLAQPLQEALHARAEHRVLPHPGMVLRRRWRRRARARPAVAGKAGTAPSARISPLWPLRTSSWLAGRSDSSGTQPWAMASSTDTDTESLLRQADGTSGPAHSVRPSLPRRGGRRSAPGPAGPALRACACTAPSSEPSLATTSRACGHCAAMAAKHVDHALRRIDRLQAAVGEEQRIVLGRRQRRQVPPGRRGRSSPRARRARACAGP